jgi:iron complex transport system substrate-binding protein
MKKWMGGAALTVVVVLLGACAPGTSKASGSQGDGYPATINHKYGTTTLDKAPLRVVALGLTDQDALVALGVVPVATREWFGKKPGALFPWARAKIGESPLPEVLPFELDFEKIAALGPDVIVALNSALTREEYETLSKIAPTIAQPSDVVDWGVSWQQSTLTIGAVVGKKSEAESLVAQVESRLSQAQKAYPTLVGKRAQVITPYGWPSTIYAYGTQDIRGRFLTGLGLKLLPEVDNLAGTSFGASISREKLNLFDLDTVIWLTDNAEQEKTLRTDPVWSQLNVARQGRDVYIQDGTEAYDALNFCTVLSIPVAIDLVAPLLVKAVDGDPTTK